MRPVTVSRSQPKKQLQESCNKRLPPPGLVIPIADLKRGRAAVSAKAVNVAQPFAAPAGNGLSGSLESLLLARGIRLTQQRLAVVRVIEATPQCRNIGVILRRAKKINPAIHRVTVYRTLALLKRHGMIGRDDSGCTGANSCPYASECSQVQMKCLHCGRTIEFESEIFGDVTRCVERDCRFRLASATLSLSGYCQDCRT
jgi:Fur family ferric uptake transcriptional regulator